jgi:hypothetical protein
MNYVSISELNTLLDKVLAPVMISTFLPSFVRNGNKNGGHAIVILKTVKDRYNQTAGYLVSDPFGNFLNSYSGEAKYNGHKVFMPMTVFRSVAKTLKNDGGDDENLYRVIYAMY